MNTLIRLGQTSKMPGFSFGLDAEKCNVGSKLRSIKGSTCEKCYAFKGRYPTPSVKKNRATNLDHIKSPYFVYVMSYQLQDQKYFRWFDSGDLPDIKALLKIVKIAENTPYCKHWLPTREYKLIRDFLSVRKFPNNLIVRVSGPMVDGPKPNGFELTSTVHKEAKPIGFSCPAIQQGGKCLNCRKCWDRRTKNISYKIH